MNLKQGLEAISCRDDFDYLADDLISALPVDANYIECVREIISFMEEHPKVDYGSPGSLVQFVEGLRGKGYESLLVGSIRRRPTAHTLWMLNRLINGTNDLAIRTNLIELLRSVAANEKMDSGVLEVAREFLKAQLSL